MAVDTHDRQVFRYRIFARRANAADLLPHIFEVVAEEPILDICCEVRYFCIKASQWVAPLCFDMEFDMVALFRDAMECSDGDGGGCDRCRNTHIDDPA